MADHAHAHAPRPLGGGLLTRVVMILLILVPLAIFNKYQAEAQERRT